MPGPWRPKKMLDWPSDAVDLPTPEVVKLYEAGFAGAKFNQRAYDEFKSSMQWPNGEDAAHEFGLADTGAGKLVIPFIFALETYPGCWPGIVGQGTGDCVSWSSRNSCLGTHVCDIVGGKPDDTTGQLEGKVDVSPEGISHGVFSSEIQYWFRGHGDQGWYCPGAATIATKTAGLVIRKNYPELGVDLTTYSATKATKYGSRPPPASEVAHLGKNLVHTATELSSAEACRDYLWNGYFLSTCGSEGLAAQRDANGVSRRKGNWSHAMAYIGFDDRDVIKQLYNQPLVLDLNSWQKWNSGPRDIYQSAVLVPADKKALWTQLGIVNASTGNIMIPEGSCWVPWSDFQRREVIAYSGVNGWPAKNLPIPWIF